MADTLDQKRRQQNRDSQRRYRKRQRMQYKHQILEVADAYGSGSLIDPASAVPVSSVTMPWVGNFHDREDTINGLFPQTHDNVPAITRETLQASHNEVCYEDSDTAINPRNRNSPSIQQYTYPASLQPTNPLLLHLPTSENDGTNINLNSYGSTKEMDSQLNGAMAAAPISRRELRASPIALPISVEGYSSQVTWITPPSSTHMASSIEERSSPATKQYWHGKRPKSSIGSEARSRSQTSVSRVNSSAVEMLVGVEKLYEFGVSIGILPEDKEMSLSLNRMKHRFMSLAASADIDNGSTDRSSEEDSDNS